MNKCKHFDPELNICTLHSDWSSPMPILNPCVESPCEDYSPPKEGSGETVENEFINRKDLIDNLNRFAPEKYSALVNSLIMKQPAVDVIDVIRCENCDYWDEKHKVKHENSPEDGTLVDFAVCTYWSGFESSVTYCTRHDNYCSQAIKRGCANG